MSDFKHWTKDQLLEDRAKYAVLLRRGLEENRARGYALVPVEGYADQIDRINWVLTALTHKAAA